MRYLKWCLIALIAVLAVFELALNLEVLRQELMLELALPFHPLGILVMPLWVALLFVFIFAFALAVLLEVGAWYEYSRTIRLQRRQIKALQDVVERTLAKPEPPGGLIRGAAPSPNESAKETPR